MVGPGSHRNVIWKGKCGHEWPAVIKNRVAGAGCPYCSHNKVLAGFNDLETLYPEVAKEWSDRNLPLLPSQVTAFANKKVWWKCSEGHEWFTLISTRSSGSKCPYCSGIKLLKGFNDLATTHPDLALEWSERNGDLHPDMVNDKSTKIVWWERTKGYIILKKILYLTDLSYKAKGRNYSEEDIYITDKLKNKYDVVLCHPKCAVSYEDYADIVVFRNTGSVIGYKDIYFDFLKRVSEKKLKTFNSFDGKADMKGKQYLLELTAEKYPVIPTIDSVDDISILPKSDLFVIKPKDGADSIGLDFVTPEEINGRNICPGTMLIQPAIDFQYEVSFYFIDDKFEYALYAPDKSKRWVLKEYNYTDEDIAFARRFIEWNTVTHGIQRVDACRTNDGELLLVELEDLNPYLSILDVNEKIRHKFLNDMMETLEML